VNHDASKILDASKSGREGVVDRADIAFMMLEHSQEYSNFNDGFNYPYADKCID
jgi:hypothetical protein